MIRDYVADSKMFSAVVGVNPGYDGQQFKITEPKEAAQIVAKKLIKKGISGTVFPGAVLYDQSRGCPNGGEVVGVAFASKDQNKGLLRKFDKVRKCLDQTTVSVITAPSSGVQMRGFLASFGRANLDYIANSWQDDAAYMAEHSGIHVSATVFQDSLGEVFVQAEANPTRINNLNAWERDASTILQSLQAGTEATFRTVGYHYLNGQTPG